jgi:hypothetical protein
MINFIRQGTWIAAYFFRIKQNIKFYGFLVFSSEDSRE